MNRIVVAALVVATGLTWTATASAQAGRELTVGPNGQYKTIQAAADVARPATPCASPPARTPVA